MSHSPEKNPYRPGVGIRPLFLAGRSKAASRFSATLKSAPEIPAAMRLTGLRGVGKTVLLDVLAEEAGELGWQTASLEFQPSHNSNTEVARVVGELLDRTQRRLSKIAKLKAAAKSIRPSMTLSWEDVSVELSPGDVREADLAEKLFQTVELSLSKGSRGLCLLLDEAQLIQDAKGRDGEHPLSLLLAPIVALQRNEVPLAVVVCGLPTLTGNLQRARSYSERMWRGEQVGSLSGEDAKEAFLEPLTQSTKTATVDLAERVSAEVEGYPYFIQLWGWELWNAADAAGLNRLDAKLLETIRSLIYERLDSDFYEPRMATMSPAEQELLLSSASCSYPPLHVSELQGASSKGAGNVNVLLGRLVEAGALYRLQKGRYEYTAPQFHSFLKRQSASVT